MSINVITQFKTKPGRAEELIASIRELLSESLQQPGCEEVTLRQNEEERNDIVAAQKWSSRRHYDDYMARHGRRNIGLRLSGLLCDELEVRYFCDLPVSTAAPKDRERKPAVLRLEVPKISTSDAPGG